MLSTVPQDIPLREHSHLDLQQAPDSGTLEDRLCPGCKRSAVNEQGGLVVAFGQSFFHVDCFKCAKCRNQVTADTNLLLLSDGSPICADCSYSCNICHLPILDEAIMTGDDSYHAHCFKCKVCHSRIDELVFAKTSQGIYCMNCHNERMIKIRKHAQKKAERERANNSTGGSSRSRDHEGRNMPRDSERQDTRTLSTPKSDQRFSPGEAARSPAKKSSGSYSTEPVDSSPPAYNPHERPGDARSIPRTTVNGQSQPSKSNTLPLPISRDGPDPKRSNSFDDGSGQNGKPTQQISQSSGLAVTSRQERRRSIVPGLAVSQIRENPVSLSPHSTTFRPRSSSTSSPTPDHTPETGPSRQTSLSSFGRTDEESNVIVTSPSKAIEQTPSPGEARSYAQTRVGVEGSKRQSGTSVMSLERPRAGTPSRSASPAYRADVPHGIESGTDTEAEGEAEQSTPHSRTSNPPIPPPKDRVQVSNGENEQDSAELSPGDEALDQLQSIEHTSHSTFIAPALPPIRFSMNTADFSELLTSVGGLPSLKSLDQLAKTTTNGVNPSTPPSTASLAQDKLSSDQSSAPPRSSDRSVHQLTPTASSASLSASASDIRIVTSDTPGDADETLDPAVQKAMEAIQMAKDANSDNVKLDLQSLESILRSFETYKAESTHLKQRFERVNRASKQYIDGLTVAQAEYDQELKARRDAEAEVTRLRVLLSGQAVRLTALSGDSRRQELHQQMSKELHDNLSGLEQDLSRLKVERDMTVAEMEELSATKSATNSYGEPVSTLGRQLTKRLDGIRTQYQRELVPLTQQKEALAREIAELKGVRDVFLEETTVLNARNEELAQLSAVYARRLESLPDAPPRKSFSDTTRTSSEALRNQNHSPSLLPPSISTSTSSSSATVYEDPMDQRGYRNAEYPMPAKAKFKWPGTKMKENSLPSMPIEMSKSKAHIEHNFQQLSVLRFTRCDHCGDKMWGSQLRCTTCAISIHVRCIAQVHLPCSQHNMTQESSQSQTLLPSMFGRDLIEQVRADAADDDSFVPIIVEKCIEAVEVRAIDYEGIYRKTGGSGQTKAITQLFERGDYTTFDLCDADRFNDICSVTSVLKTYFRSLPVPLLTFDLHDQFTSATSIRDPVQRHKTLSDLVKMLPIEHYCTLRLLMLHLHRVHERNDRNLMNARNLGVVFGPTLMRSRDPAAEFSDMAGKALFVEWLVESAPQVFS